MAKTIIQIQQEKLSYLTVAKNLRKLARDTNVPVRFLRDLQAGVARIPTLEIAKFNAYYRRETYANLREAGMNTSQATRFSGQSVETVTNAQFKVSRIIDHLTGGILGSRKQKLQARGLAWDEDFEYEKARASIWEGLRTSRKTIEQWEGY